MNFHEFTSFHSEFEYNIYFLYKIPDKLIQYTRVSNQEQLPVLDFDDTEVIEPSMVGCRLIPEDTGLNYLDVKGG